MSKNFKVTCSKCGGQSRLSIDQGNRVTYQDHLPIIAARFRGDKKWGFECTCGNDSRLCIEEKKDLGMLVQGSGGTIDKIKKSLSAKNERLFTMEAI